MGDLGQAHPSEPHRLLRPEGCCPPCQAPGELRRARARQSFVKGTGLAAPCASLPTHAEDNEKPTVLFCKRRSRPANADDIAPLEKLRGPRCPGRLPVPSGNPVTDFCCGQAGRGVGGGWAKKRRRSHERGRRRRGHDTLVAVLPGLLAGRATPGRPPPAQSVTEGGSPGFHGSRLSSAGFSFRHEQSVNHPAAVGVTRAAFSWRDSEGAPRLVP